MVASEASQGVGVREGGQTGSAAGELTPPNSDDLHRRQFHLIFKENFHLKGGYFVEGVHFRRFSCPPMGSLWVSDQKL